MFELKGIRASKENVIRAEAVDDMMERLDDLLRYAEKQVKDDEISNKNRYTSLKEQFPDASEEELIDYASWEYRSWCENAAKVYVLKSLKHDFVKAFLK